MFLDKLIQLSLRYRLFVIVIALIMLVSGTYTALKLPVDVFPDLTAPTVKIMTEAHGMAPEEVESQVTFPIESAVNGSSGVRRVRSNSIQGLSIIWVEFDWGTDIYVARQLVTEKIQGVKSLLPEDVDSPVLTPISSMMSEIMFIGLTSDSVTPMELRTLADYSIRRRLLAIPGVSQVLVYGGEVKQYQVLLNPRRLQALNVSITEIVDAVSESNISATGGLMIDAGQEYLIRGLGRIENINDLGETVVTVRNGIPLILKDVADVKIGAATKLGTSAINEKPGVTLLISRQPEVNTIELTKNINAVLADLEKSLPEGITLHKDIFRQSDFIEVAVNNVFEALRDGAILVTIVLLLFLLNIRTTVISLTAIPLSLIVSIFVMKMFDLSINTMTLGGMAIAIGALVDDAIIDVENIYRRLRENSKLPEEKRTAYNTVVLEASKEIRAPITLATLIVIIVFVPIFFLSGVEGRMLKPLGLAYVVSIFTSLLVAVSVTPAMSSVLLKKTGLKAQKESWLVRQIKKAYEPSLKLAMKLWYVVIILSIAGIIAALAILPTLGRSFLPEFNEGTLTLSVATIPGTSLEESDKLGAMVDQILLTNPEVLSTARRTGRTELDEHSMGSYAHEVEVRIETSETPKEVLLARLRQQLQKVPGAVITIGQPISHRIDHMLSGTRANIAVKIFGPDLLELRSLAGKVENALHDVEGLVDLSVDLQVDIPQVRIFPDRRKMAQHGLRSGDIDNMIDAAFLGKPVSQVYENSARYDLVVRYEEEYRDNLDAIKSSLVDSPVYGFVPLGEVTNIRKDRGPNFISRENGQRKIVVQANVADKDLRGVIDDVAATIEEKVEFPEGYYLEFGGQFESEAEATRRITFFSIIAILAIFMLLYLEFHSLKQALLVMVNLPLALIGGVLIIFVTKGIVSIASMVGFITLFGIAVRNGILMVDHYNHLVKEGNCSFREAVIRGSMERLNPVLMTALTTGLALVPLAFSGHKPGSEIQSPMSIVILGGLLTSTFLTLIVLPVLFDKWGKEKK